MDSTVKTAPPEGGSEDRRKNELVLVGVVDTARRESVAPNEEDSSALGHSPRTAAARFSRRRPRTAAPELRVATNNCCWSCGGCCCCCGVGAAIAAAAAGALHVEAQAHRRRRHWSRPDRRRG